MTGYCELHTHDEWSLLDGVGTALHGATRAAELGMPALAKTNHAVLSGVVHHMNACNEVGIVPIVAVEAYYRENRISKSEIDAMRKRGENVEKYWEYFHMVILAKNTRGWRSLKLLTSEAYRSGFYRYPCLDDDLLDRHHEGIIISTSCVSGFIPRAIKRGDDKAVKSHIGKLDRWCGDDWYFEIQPHDFDDLRVVNREIVSLGAQHGRPVVATKDAHFPTPEWAKTQQVSVMMRTQQTFKQRARAIDEGEKYDLTAPETCYIGGAQDTISLFDRYHSLLPKHAVSEAVRNTGEIAGRCMPFMLDRSPKMPSFYDDPERGHKELRRLVYEGLKDLGHRHDPIYEKQAEHELKILKDKDFSDFFLINWDLIRWCRSTDPLPATKEDPNPLPRERPMIISARGSAGGSVVSYALQIVTINPITWGLRFERFLNYDREGLPDIDLDFAPGDADLAKEYLKRKYGRNKVYDMIAHGTMAAKGAIRRVSIVFDVPSQEYNVITKKISDDDNEEKIADLRGYLPELDRYLEKYPDVAEHAGRLQGQVGTISEHAAAVVLSKVPLDELMPVMKKSVDDDYMVTAFGEASNTQIVSSLGFLKLDLLVVIELAKQAYAVDLIREHYDVDVRLDKLGVDEDPYAVEQDVMETIRRGLHRGIFQLGGSSGISATTKRSAPENMLHLAAINAVYRPATLSKGIASEYIARRHDPSKITYWDPSIADVLRETFGLLIYQEQVMDIFMMLGGFSPTRADNVRKIMSKWYRAKGDIAERMLGAHREDFIAHAAGIVSGGRPAAEAIWNFNGGFCEYSFNKSHAGLYAILSYRDAWLKTRYPDCFYAALLSNPPAKIRKPEERRPFYESTIREARLLGVDVKPPDINESDKGFTLVKPNVRFGLGSIKGLGPVSVAELLERRPFASWEDLVARSNKCNSTGRRALGSSGALDAWGVRDDLTEDERLDGEEDRLGIALSVPDRIGDMRDAIAALIHSQAEFDEAPNGEVLCVGGEVIGGKEITTKYGNEMGRLTIAFGADEYIVSVRPKYWEHAQEKTEDGEVVLGSVKSLVATDEPLIVRGTKDEAYDSISADRVELASTILAMVA